MTQIEHIICRRIQERTSGRIRNLRVERCVHGLVVRGQASHFYVKQLALNAGMSVSESGQDAPLQIHCDIEVDP